MDITRFAIEKRRTTAVSLAVILIAGISAYNTLSRNEDPGFIIRTAMVQTIFPGASPERVELLVTDKLEKVIQEMPELDFVSSESKTGLSVIYVNILESETNMRPIWDSLRRKVDRAKAELPELIILDVMMPEMDGIETCKELRTLPEFKNTVITFLTARNEDYSQIAGFDAGADDYITKPIKPRVMMRRIKALMRRVKDEAEADTLIAGNIEVDRTK